MRTATRLDPITNAVFLAAASDGFHSARADAPLGQHVVAESFDWVKAYSEAGYAQRSVGSPNFVLEFDGDWREPGNGQVWV